MHLHTATAGGQAAARADRNAGNDGGRRRAAGRAGGQAGEGRARGQVAASRSGQAAGT